MVNDPLLRYVVALDAGDFATVGQVLHQAEIDEGLSDAIDSIHSRFDVQESFTEHLQRVRAELTTGANDGRS